MRISSFRRHSKHLRTIEYKFIKGDKEMKRRIACVLFSLIFVLTAASFTVNAAGIVDGCEAYVKVGSMSVTKSASVSSKTIAVVYLGDKVTVLEAYVNGKDKYYENFHHIRLYDGTEGYCYAYANRKDTLESMADLEQKIENSNEKDDKYQHGINMIVLSDYIYGGKRATEGEAILGYGKVPNEWTRHKRPSSLPLVGKAVLHIGDSGKEGMVRASFYPEGYYGSPSGNYHARRLDELQAIGYAPIGADNTRNNKNWAFFACTGSEFDVVAYDEKWVAVWSEGGIDRSRGIGAPCGGAKYVAYGSWKPGVYFIPRQYCYILDINNQVTTPPEIVAMGKATEPLMVKTTPDANDYVKSGVYKVNQSFQIVESTPINGHYKIYYKHGLYYVDAAYVNMKLNNVRKPLTAYAATVDTSASQSKTVNIYSAPNTASAVVAMAKNGAAFDIIDSDISGEFVKVWFNTKECYVETKYLTDFQKTASGSGISALGRPIGVLVIDSPWSAYGQLAYSPEGFEIVKQYNYGETYKAYYMLQELNAMNGAISKMEEKDWANVYKVEHIVVTPDPDYPDETETATIYTVVYDGNVRYIYQNDEQYQTFTYYPGNGYRKTTVAKSQPLYVDTTEYKALAYNIDGNNYFKLRDIAKMLSGTVKSFDVEYDAATNSIDMLSYFSYTTVGGELAAGDGAVRTAYSSSAFLTLDGIPVQAACYNIEGNNYFKLRDVTDALDCRVEWKEKERTIVINTSLPAYDDPNEPVG